ncbi:ribosomal protection tetracycline resistance protein [Murinocardiopsis flavida]|uniref:Ribosomal protection tetracycline resistance protein n=1 Tax=Murinocardiopsis flavida TaxID=645275 RepID=A0A2P8DUD0_9ACTN|nr:GTP-binding protein [Murinocardiopsis flavida]PSL00828.1 ribosomal protection tetracycline resistance protein [Murinocardiopsis flavida]
MPTLNIGILAHVDAGKTSLTERILYDAGAIERLGSVDAGTTRTDTGAIERERGITVRSAVASFTVGGLRVNLVDTPGHSDFIAEVERALGVLDGAVLVLSAVEGVQPQTRVLMRTLRAMRLPTVLFANKIDRAGARDTALLAEIRRRLTAHIVPVNRPTDAGTAGARVAADPGFPGTAADVLADNDDALLEALVSGPAPTGAEIEERLAAQTAAGTVHPLFFGSALSGTGVAALVEGVARLLPTAAADTDGAARGTVFAVERGRAGEATGYLRLDAGRLRVRQRVAVHRSGPDGAAETVSARITGLQVIGAPADAREPLTAGNLAKVRGLPGVRVGDRIGAAEAPAEQQRFTRPSLETLVRPRRSGDAARLHAALVALADQDPWISTRSAPGEGTSVLLYGEVQKEIIAATLAAEFDVEAVFAPSRVVYSERPTGTGEAFEAYDRQPRPRFYATIGLRVAPAPAGDTGNAYGVAVEDGSLPRAFHRAIEEAVVRTLGQGLHGWPVTGCSVTLTRSGYASPVSTAADFRELAPLVLMRALAEAGTRVYEPYHEYEAEVPAGALSAVAAQFGALGVGIGESAGDAETAVLRGAIPARLVAEVERRLPGLSHGEGVWWSRASADRAVAGRAPERPRTDGNPLDREEYLRHLSQRRSAVGT